MLENKQFHEQPFSKTRWLGEKVLKIRATEIIQTIFQNSDLKCLKQQLLFKHKNNSHFLRNYSSVMCFFHNNRYSHIEVGNNPSGSWKSLGSPFGVYLNELDTKDAVKLGRHSLVLAEGAPNADEGFVRCTTFRVFCA